MVRKHIYDIKKNYSVYLLLDKDTKKFYIWYGIHEHLANTYRRHFTGQINKTKDWFEELKGVNKKPCIFILETHKEISRPECYVLTLVWNNIFLELGYQGIERQEILDESKDIYEENLDKLQNRKTIDINEMIDCKRCIMPKYKNIICPLYIENNIEKLKRKPEKSKRVEIKLNEDQYETIMEYACNYGMTMNNYIKKAALEKEIVIYDYEELRHFCDLNNQLQKKLNQYIITLLSTTCYYPEEIGDIQNSIDNLVKEEKAILALLRKRRNR